MRTFAIRTDSGRLVQDKNWHSIADVVMPTHGLGIKEMRGQLVYRDNDEEEWKEWNDGRAVSDV